jgi:S1-C subfamily serine protease
MILEEVLQARVVYRDAPHDLAIVRLEQPLPARATIVHPGESLPDVGSIIYAIGHPRDQFWSIHSGLLSQVRKDHRWEEKDGSSHSATVIQTDANITQGSSGGPIFDENGNWIGVVYGGDQSVSGISFAIAIEHVKMVLELTAK